MHGNILHLSIHVLVQHECYVKYIRDHGVWKIKLVITQIKQKKCGYNII